MSWMGKSIELTILYHNASSIYHKLDELYAMILFQKSDLICNVESWLSEDMTDHSYCCLIWYVWPWCIPLQVVSHIIQCDTLMTRDLDLKVCFYLMAHAVWFLISSLQQGVIAGRENSLMEDCHHAPHLCPCCMLVVIPPVCCVSTA